jgi:hypothetical protein
VPAQIVALFALGTIAPPIVTVAVVVAVQLAADVPVIVYTVVAVGLATTVDPVDALSDELGDHVYVLAPDALRFVEAPGQIVAEPTVRVGVGLTVIAAVPVLTQFAALVPVTV